MKILITGGGGYIGSVLTPMLLARGDEVTVLDNFMYQQTPLLDCCHYETLSVVKGDVRDHDKLRALIAKHDAIIPLACYTGAPLCDKDPWGAYAVNYEHVKAVMAAKSKSQRLVFPNTNSGYGVGEAGKFCTEDSPLNPVSNYGVWKVRLEEEMLATGEAVTFRFATVFGVSPRPRLDLLVNDFTYRAVHDGAVVLFEADFKRNFLHVRDAARAFIHALDNYDALKGRPYNVGLSDANLSKRELCEALKKQLPRFEYVVAPIGKDPDQRNYIVSNERIEGTGFRTTVSLEQGIRELIKGYQILKRMQFANV